MPEDNDVIDVAIIGAGVSGAYCAYRLTSDTALSVEVFERNTRVGGRLWSYRWPEADALVELGGEAFSPIHANVAGLVRTLGLTAVPHKEFSTQNRLYLRDQLLAFEDLLHRSSFPRAAGAEAKVRYFVPDDYLKAMPGPDDRPAGPKTDVINDPFTFLASHILKWVPADVRAAFDALCAEYVGRVEDVTGAGELTPDQALTLMTPKIYEALGTLIAALEAARFKVSPATAKIVGQDLVPIHEFDFWSVVVRDFGQEVYELLRGAGYDNTSALYYNMLELFQNLLIGALLVRARPAFWSLEGGFDTLPKALIQQAVTRRATLTTDRALTGISRDAATGVLTLRFVDATGAIFGRQARRVIMAAPLVAFDGDVTLDGFDADLTARFAANRQSTFSVHAGKLFLVYPDPWWSRMSDLSERDDPLYGYANTDMPSRAVYYKGLCGDGKRALITGALTDGINADFWASFLRPGAAIFPGTGGGTPGDLGAPVFMVDACHRILHRMHAGGLRGKMDVPDLALYHGWITSGGGWSAWHSGVVIHEVAAQMRRPFTTETLDQGLYCCGDSVAERHGWVENVLESAETMLRDAFGLEPAAWLPSKVTF